jgi:hypothetical protein
MSFHLFLTDSDMFEEQAPSKHQSHQAQSMRCNKSLDWSASQPLLDFPRVPDPITLYQVSSPLVYLLQTFYNLAVHDIASTNVSNVPRDFVLSPHVTFPAHVGLLSTPV